MNQGLSTSPTSVALPAYLYFNINENISYCQSCLEKYARLSFRSLTRSKTVVTCFPNCLDLPRSAPQVPPIPGCPTRCRAICREIFNLIWSLSNISLSERPKSTPVSTIPAALPSTIPSFLPSSLPSFFIRFAS